MMKRFLIVLASLLCVAGVVNAQTINYMPTPYIMAISSDGGATYQPATFASGIGAVNYTPRSFVPMCSANGLPPYSQCNLGGGGGLSVPPLTYDYHAAAVSDNGVGYASGFTRYDNNEPQVGSVGSATSALGYLLFTASPAAPQYAETTIDVPPYWNGTGLYFSFYSSATTGNAVMDVQTACATVAGTPTFSAAVTTTLAASTTANGIVNSAEIANIAGPGVNGCPAAGSTTPTRVTIRIYADSTSAIPVYLLGATFVTGRSQ